ncbi:hypothetical protein RFI_28263 [Reticulomyxa filosa]|uniref:Uncharacterized protein n=1 Tax=Reticulomyxa filosa TaxID=46433 RepID=X6M7W8_RETFI|nr:hypothetical protein RFI_28263 [Reticulomyxa filosa]|eukprot:ETO09125.1 hypothetical protein RFI_28263 [Reticulomyxa filosa]
MNNTKNKSEEEDKKKKKTTTTTTAKPDTTTTMTIDATILTKRHMRRAQVTKELRKVLKQKPLLGEDLQHPIEKAQHERRKEVIDPYFGSWDDGTTWERRRNYEQMAFLQQIANEPKVFAGKPGEDAEADEKEPTSTTPSKTSPGTLSKTPPATPSKTPSATSSKN